MSFNESRLPNSNYPPMSQTDWDNAPWNQVDPETLEFEIEMSLTVTLSANIDSDEHEDGYYKGNIKEDFKEQHYSISGLMEELANRLKADIANPSTDRIDKQVFKDMLEDAEMYAKCSVEEIEEL